MNKILRYVPIKPRKRDRRLGGGGGGVCTGSARNATSKASSEAKAKKQNSQKQKAQKQKNEKAKCEKKKNKKTKRFPGWGSHKGLGPPTSDDQHLTTCSSG